MKKLYSSRRVYISIYIFIIMLLIIIYSEHSVKRCFGMDITFCLNDVLGFVEHYLKIVTIPLFAIITVVDTEKYFRTSVVLRIVNGADFIQYILVRLFPIILGLSFIQTFFSVVYGIRISTFTCNWYTQDSYPYKRLGITSGNYINTYQFILLYFVAVILTLTVTSVIMITCRLLTNRAYSGFMVVLTLLALELMTYVPFSKIIFSVSDLNRTSIYTEGITVDFWVNPLIIIISCLIIQMLVYTRKDYLRMS
ncbi:MAG: hypothetical protein ACI4D4_01460 [Lachnospira sp.]